MNDNHIPRPLFPTEKSSVAEPETIISTPLEKKSSVRKMDFSVHDDASQQPRPEITPVLARVARPLFPASPPRPPAPLGQKPLALSLPGVFVRKRIPITDDDLREINPDITDDAVFARVIEYVHYLNPEESGFEERIRLWGQKEQEDFASLSNDILTLATSQVLDDVRAQIKRIKTLVMDANIEKLFRHGSGLMDLMRGQTFESAKQAFIGKLNDIASVSLSIKSKTALIDQCKKTLRIIQQKSDIVFLGIQSSLASARFLRGYLTNDGSKPCYRDWSTILERRADSLAMSRLAANQSVQQLKVLNDSFCYFQDVVNNTLVTLIPVWNTNCVGILTRARTENEASRDGSWHTVLKDKNRIVEILQSIKL